MLINSYDSDYYIWLLDRVGSSEGEAGETYQHLLQLLFSTEYTYSFVMDGNRAKGGERLRSIFALESGVFLDDVCIGPCTVLEMLVSLAAEMRDNARMSLSYWFWKMIDNLHLLGYDDDNFDECAVTDILNRWMHRKYEPSGEGSIFPIPDFDGDMRNIEVWDQMNIYLTKLYPVGNWLT